MRRLQTLSLGLIVLAGSFLGGAFATAGRQAWAQQQPPPNVAVNEFVQVPPTGLRFLAPSGAVLAVLADRGGNAVFTLFDASGKPGVVFAAGPSATLAYQGVAGGELSLRPATGGDPVVLRAGPARAEALVGKYATVASTAEGAAVRVSNAAQSRSAELAAGKAGVAFRSVAGADTLFELSATERGMLRLGAVDGKRNVELRGDGTLAVTEAGAPVWTAPPGS